MHLRHFFILDCFFFSPADLNECTVSNLFSFIRYTDGCTEWCHVLTVCCSALCWWSSLFTCSYVSALTGMTFLKCTEHGLMFPVRPVPGVAVTSSSTVPYVNTFAPIHSCYRGFCACVCVVWRATCLIQRVLEETLCGSLLSHGQRVDLISK